MSPAAQTRGDLVGTTSAQVLRALDVRRRRTGRSSPGLVFTLVVLVEPRGLEAAVDAAVEATEDHPARIVALVPRAPKGPTRLDADVRYEAGAPAAELVVLSLRGGLVDAIDTVVAPLLLPDVPVVAWWPGAAPADLGAHPVGRLADRRISDAAAAGDALAALRSSARSYSPGDTDLAWTRATIWRTHITGALDGVAAPPGSGVVEAERGNPTAALIAAWLRHRLGVPVTLRWAEGPGIVAVRLRTERGEVAVVRPSRSARAVVSSPGEPDRTVALPRRGLGALLDEELRRLDADEPYAEALAAVRPAAVRPTSASPTRQAPTSGRTR